MSASGIRPTSQAGQPRTLAELLPSPANTPRSLIDIVPGSLVTLRLFRESNPRIRTTIARRFEAIPPAVNAAFCGWSPFPWFIHGKPGTGKTCAALAVADRVVGVCLYREFSDLCNEINEAKSGQLMAMGTHDSSRVTLAGYWERWQAAKLCILDDVGLRQKSTEPQYEALKTAIDRRHGRALIVVSNHDLDRVSELYDDRIASRLASGTVINADGDDRRLA